MTLRKSKEAVWAQQSVPLLLGTIAIIGLIWTAVLWRRDASVPSLSNFSQAEDATTMDMVAPGPSQLDLPDGTALLHTQQFTSGGDNGHCISLQERHLYALNHNLVPYDSLLQALREYEEMHRSCVMQVTSWLGGLFKGMPGQKGCKYLYWREMEGLSLSDRLMSLLTAFEYALLTRRALIVSTEGQMDRLLCNPFEGSWMWAAPDLRLPRLDNGDFTLRQMVMQNPQTYPDAVRGRVVDIRLTDGEDSDAPFFVCPEVQDTLSRVRWLTWNSNQYFGPALFVVPTLEKHLTKMFPDRLVTSHMARYLLLPVNEVWRKVTRLYDVYVGGAALKVGLQVQTFMGYDEALSQRILKCITDNEILPAPLVTNQTDSVGRNRKNSSASSEPPQGPFTSLLVASADAEFFEDFKEAYMEGADEAEWLVVVETLSQPCEEKHTLATNRGALVEIWLLSFSDTLLISYRSSFGLLTNALRGENIAYSLNTYKDDWRTNRRPVCEKTRSTNVCLHNWPIESRCPGAPQDNTRRYIKTCSKGDTGGEVVRRNIP